MPKYRRGSGTVYTKRGWCYIAYSVSGKRICEATRTKDKVAAHRLLQARLGQLAEGRFIGPAAERVTFADMSRWLLNDYQVNQRRTRAAVVTRLDRHLIPHFGEMRAHQITTAEVTAYITHRQAHQACPGTINLELAHLSRMFTLGLRMEKLTRKPHIPFLTVNNARQGFFERANLCGADLVRTKFQQANLQQADMHKADLEEADLPRAKLQEANLSGAKLQRADLRNARLQRINL